MSNGYVQLEPSEMVEERPFTDPIESMQDLAILQYMLEKLRRLVSQPDGIPVWPRPFISFAPEPGERYHRITISRQSKLREGSQLTVVGFCGHKRPGIDRTTVDALDEALIAQFPQHPFLLSYSTMQLEGGNSRNLVLFDKPQGLAHWLMSETHAQAVEISPGYYTCIRLHNAILPGGLMSGSELTLLRTKYYDYQGDKTWWAVRELSSRAEA